MREQAPEQKSRLIGEDSHSLESQNRSWSKNLFAEIEEDASSSRRNSAGRNEYDRASSHSPSSDASSGHGPFADMQSVMGITAFGTTKGQKHVNYGISSTSLATKTPSNFVLQARATLRTPPGRDPVMAFMRKILPDYPHVKLEDFQYSGEMIAPRIHFQGANYTAHLRRKGEEKMPPKGEIKKVLQRPSSPLSFTYVYTRTHLASDGTVDKVAGDRYRVGLRDTPFIGAAATAKGIGKTGYYLQNESRTRPLTWQESLVELVKKAAKDKSGGK